MKKIVALALALIMVLSMGVVAFAAQTDEQADAMDEKFPDSTAVTLAAPAPGEKNPIEEAADYLKKDYKVSYDFTSSKYGFNGASLIESIAYEKNAEASKLAGEPVYDLVLTIKENLTGTTAKQLTGMITLTAKVKNAEGEYDKFYFFVDEEIKNEVEYISGAKKAADADYVTDAMVKNTVMFAEDGAGYVKFVDEALTGTVKVAKDEKAQVYILDQAETEAADEDLVDAIEAYLGEDYDAIVEWYNFCGTGFDADVDFAYDAWAEDPHFFYAWDGEKFVDLEAKYDDDEDVDDYVFSADAKGLIIVTDVEIVAGAEEETKNPDTGANDVVGVAAALAVVSLVAAGAVSLKK